MTRGAVHSEGASSQAEFKRSDHVNTKSSKKLKVTDAEAVQAAMVNFLF